MSLHQAIYGAAPSPVIARGCELRSGCPRAATRRTVITEPSGRRAEIRTCDEHQAAAIAMADPDDRVEVGDVLGRLTPYSPATTCPPTPTPTPTATTTPPSDPEPAMTSSRCIVRGCSRTWDSHGLCTTHRGRATRLGLYQPDTEAMRALAPRLDALWAEHRAKVEAATAKAVAAGRAAAQGRKDCIVPGCPAKRHVLGMCCTHDKRAVMLGIPRTLEAYAAAAPTLDARWKASHSPPPPLPPTPAGVMQAAHAAPADVVLPYQLPTAPTAPPDALEQIEQVLGLPPGESSETEVIWQVRKLRQRAEAAEAALAELRTAADHAETRADDYRAQLRIAEEEVSRLTGEAISLRASLAAAMAPMTEAEVERRYTDLVRARRYLAAATGRGVVGVVDAS